MTNRIFDRLQVVILESPYDTLNTEEGKKLFAQLMELKILGYTHIHSNGVLPFDSSDFIATHLVISDREDPNRILMTYKSVSLFECKKYNLTFPFLALLEKANSKTCFEEMLRITNECWDQQKDLSYDTGWTINPEVRNDKELQTVLKDMVTTFVINHHNHYQIPHWVTLGICKVKTDQYFLKMGLKEISKEPLIEHPYLHQTQARAVISMDQKYSPFTFETGAKYQELWDKRVTIAAKKGQKDIKAA